MDLILESRSKSDYSLVNRIRVTPENSVAFATHAVVGNIAMRGRYVYVAFTDSVLGGDANYYIQKRLKKDFSLVKQHITRQRIRELVGEPFPYKPLTRSEKIDLRVEGRYVQVKFYDEGLDNQVRLLNQTYILRVEDLKF